MGSGISVLDFLELGSALALRGFARCGSSLAVLDMLHLGSGLSLRSFGRLGSAISIFDMLFLGSTLSLRSRRALALTVTTQVTSTGNMVILAVRGLAVRGALPLSKSIFFTRCSAKEFLVHHM